MKKNYHELIRLLTLGVVAAAFFVTLVHRGVIPRFW